jgi:peptidoglycan/LPS O-acetylase OafA/YrhL
MLMAVGSVHLERAAPSRLLAPLYARPELAWALAAAGYLATALWADIPVYFNPRSPADEVVTQVCFVVISALVVLPATAPDRWRPRTGPVTALLDARVVVWLGLISYGIFLWHQPFLFKFIEEGVLDTQGAWVVGALVLVATLCAATLSYRLVEEPALRFKDVRFRRRG